MRLFPSLRLVGSVSVLLLTAGTVPPLRAKEKDQNPNQSQSQSRTEAASAEVMGALGDALAFLQPAPGAEARSVTADFTVRTATGGAEFLKDAKFHIQVQPPDRLLVRADIGERSVTLCQDGDKAWIYVPKKDFLIRADNTVPQFSTRPDSVRPVKFDLLTPPLSKSRLALLPVLLRMDRQPAADAGGTDYVLSPSPAAEALKLPVTKPSVTATVRDGSCWPVSVRYQDDSTRVEIEVSTPVLAAALPAAAWQPVTDSNDREEHVALCQIDRFVKVMVANLGARIPALPPAAGARHLIATEGAGRLEDFDGTRVLFLSGTPEQMGHQHGTLLKKEIRRVVERVLYGVGVGSSFEKGRWFFGEIEEAVRRTSPFIDPRHLAEMDAIAAAAGVQPEEIRLSNFFPELFHCSGFALLGKATPDGKLYHGRILDYMRGAGLEENAAVIVSRPEKGHAWVNISYAGFTGSVTAMNEKQLCVGEMGGRGEGSWDGKPMAQLVREVMEKTSTIDEALDYMRRTPRTCEYYYVISDAKSHRAAGVKATPAIFEVVWTGESHPQLTDPVSDTVLLSAGDRYRELVRRVKDGFGKFGAAQAMNLMSRPVCMKSNLHSVLFAPDNLDFYVANADSDHVASETRYTKYNLRALLDAPPAAAE
ncbi:MAG: C45 family peptidase [Verrucomicrobiota bacterium]